MKGPSSGDAHSSCWPRPGGGIPHPRWSSVPFLELQGFVFHQDSGNSAPPARRAHSGQRNLCARWQSLWVSAFSHLRDEKEVSTNLFSDIVPAQPWPRAGPLSCRAPAVCSTALGQLQPHPSAHQDTILPALAAE